MKLDKIKDAAFNTIEKIETTVKKYKTEIVLGTIGALAYSTLYYSEKSKMAIDIVTRVDKAADELGVRDDIIDTMWKQARDEFSQKQELQHKED